MTLGEFEQKLNNWGQENVPFLFFLDFEMTKPWAMPLAELRATEVLFNFQNISNEPEPANSPKEFDFVSQPLSFEQYERKFDMVREALAYGDSFLTNLTIKTPIKTSLTPEEIYRVSSARYKAYFKDKFVFFSPETFVEIEDNIISTCPMKGTIDAALPDAARLILADRKELAEHVTIVDLLRNDLSLVAEHVRVTDFRYISEVATNRKNLLQVSSRISGQLLPQLHRCFGTVLLKLLPAGSISGAPKPKTLEVIKRAEGEERGYYTGVAGVFDGRKLDTCVMIRFIEIAEKGLFYRSGGGITTQSECASEYQEAIDKIYVPVD